MTTHSVATRSTLEPATSRAVAVWSIGVVSFAFVEGITRLGLRGIETVRAGLDPLGWFALALVVGLFAYFESYLALHQRFAPAVVNRAFALRPSGLLEWLVGPLARRASSAAIGARG